MNTRVMHPCPNKNEAEAERMTAQLQGQEMTYFLEQNKR